MRLLVKHTKVRKSYEYKVYRDGEMLYKVYAQIPNILKLNRVLIYDINGREVLNVRQESYKKLILGCIPFICMLKFSVCPFNCYRDGGNVGYVREEANIIGEVDNKSFEIIEQNQKYVHIFSRGKQIGLIKRYIPYDNDGDEYIVLFNSDLKSEIATLFCIMSNISFYDRYHQSFDPSTEIVINLTRRKFNEDWEPEY